MTQPIFRAVLALLLALAATSVQAQSREDEVVRTSTGVLSEVMAIPASSIPTSLLNKATGVAIIPNIVKGGFVVGVRHGRGVMLVRDEQGVWQPPLFISLTGGSVGWQAGIQSTDLILVFRTRRSVNGLMKGKLTIGADAAAAAGPIGRKASAATDASLSAEILSYSKSRGLFAGVSIDGSSMQVDHQAGKNFYQPPGTIPPSAVKLINSLASYTSAPQIVPNEGMPGGAPEALPTVPAVPTAPAIPQTEALGAQLIQQQQKLNGILEPSWKQFLAIPTGPNGLPVADVNQLQQVLQRYDGIAGDARYVALTKHPQFATTHQLLRQYVAAAGATGRIQLPPPPGGGGPTIR